MNKEVKTVGPEASIKEAAKKMSENRIGSLIVIGEAKKMVGIVTERDILDSVSGGIDVEKTAVEKIMARKVFYVNPKSSIEDATDMMVSNKIKKLPVIAGSMLVGIITATDVAMVEPKLLEQVAKVMMVPGKRKQIAG